MFYNVNSHDLFLFCIEECMYEFMNMENNLRKEEKTRMK